MSIIVGELFLSACITRLHCTLSKETPERKHFPQPWPQDPLLNLTFILLPAHFFNFGFHAWFFLSLLAVGPNWPVYGGTGRQNPTRCPTCTPRHKNLHIGAVCQRSCFTKMEGRGGGMTKTTACVGEHCLQLRLEIFSEKKDLIHNGRGCEKRGHILKEVPLCVES